MRGLKIINLLVNHYLYSKQQDVMMDKKVYDIKFFGGIEFMDHWDLRSHPLYIQFDKKQRPHFIFRESPMAGYIKVDSLTGLANQLRTNEWTFESKYWQSISHSIQAAINLPYTKL